MNLVHKPVMTTLLLWLAFIKLRRAGSFPGGKLLQRQRRLHLPKSFNENGKRARKFSVCAFEFNYIVTLGVRENLIQQVCLSSADQVCLQMYQSDMRRNETRPKMRNPRQGKKKINFSADTSHSQPKQKRQEKQNMFWPFQKATIGETFN